MGRRRVRHHSGIKLPVGKDIHERHRHHNDRGVDSIATGGLLRECWSFITQRDKPLQLPGCLMALEAPDHLDLDLWIGQAVSAQCDNHRRTQLVHVGGTHGEDLHPGDGLLDLVFGDARIRAEYVTKSARGNGSPRVAKIVVASPTNISQPRERASAGASFGQPRDLIPEVVPNKWERPVGQPRGKRPRGWHVGRDRRSVLVDTLEEDLVLAHVQSLTVPATDCLHADLSRSPEIVHRYIPRLANRLPIVLEEGSELVLTRTGRMSRFPATAARASFPITVA
jgi:hypothetical protein